MSGCYNCDFWRPKTADSGECHRYPPTPVAIQKRDERGDLPPTVTHVNPETPPGFVCGEWR